MLTHPLFLCLMGVIVFLFGYTFYDSFLKKKKTSTTTQKIETTEEIPVKKNAIPFGSLFHWPDNSH